MKKNIIVLLIIGFCVSELRSQQLNRPKLDSFLNILSANNKIMGNVRISKNGRSLYSRPLGYSYYSAGKKVEANENTRYHIGSISKMYTAVMIFQLIDEGKLALDSRLDRYFPDIPGAANISIRLLLNHRSGLYDFVNDPQDEGWITQPHGRKEILDSISKGNPHFLPGEKMDYCNSGYWLLALIIEDITHHSYQKNLQMRICKRLGLKHTYSPVKNSLKTGEAAPYHFQAGQWQEVNDIYFPNVVGVGDILSTTSEMTSFIDALMAGKLISGAALDSMMSFQDQSFGMGMMRIPFYRRISYGHGGDTRGTHCVLAAFPEDSLEVVTCVNGEVFHHNSFLIGILSILFDRPYVIPGFKTMTPDTLLLDRCTGPYTSPDLPVNIRFYRKASVLLVVTEDQEAVQLEMTDTCKFAFYPANVTFEFFPEKKEMIMVQSGKRFVFTRKE